MKKSVVKNKNRQMVNFQIVSDLHIEVNNYTPSSSSMITPSADILILAGDIGRIHKYRQLKSFLSDTCQNFEYVLYVLGNHEFYRERGRPNKTMQQLMNDIKRIEKEIPNLYILDRSSVVIDDVCVIGCTLWSNAKIEIPPFMVRVHNMTLEKHNRIHQEDVRYIETMIKYCKEHNMKLVVVTHHVPTYSLLISKKSRNDQYKSFYASDLDHLLSVENIHTWICGHIHRNFDFVTEHGTRLVGNQRGKPRDNIQDYKTDKVISV